MGKRYYVTLNEKERSDLQEMVCLCLFTSIRFYPDAEAIDFHIFVGGNQEILPPIDDPGLHQEAPFRLHSNGGVGGFNLKAFGVYHIGGIEGRALPELLTAALDKGRDRKSVV